MNWQMISPYFDCSDLSDVELVVSLAKDVDATSGARHIMCHKIILGVGSPVLKQRLLNWEPGQQQLLIQVASADEMQAVESLVQFFYCGSLPADASPIQLLQLMVTSNKYQSEQCTVACRRRLHGLEGSTYSPQLLLGLWRLPPFLMEEALEFRAVARLAKRVLVEMFLDLEAAWQNEDLRALFVQLPAAAVKALLCLDDLAVVSENTVLLALMCWLEAQAVAVSPDVQSDLILLVRLQHLSLAYWAHVLPHILSAVKGFPKQHLRAAQAFKLGSDKQWAAVICGMKDLPKRSSIRAPPRSGTTKAVRCSQMTISSYRLQRTLAANGQTHLAPLGPGTFEYGLPVLHHNGFQLLPYLRNSSDGTRRPVRLGCHVNVGIPSFQAPALRLHSACTPPVHLRASFHVLQEAAAAPRITLGHLGMYSHCWLQNDPPANLGVSAENGQVTVQFEVDSCQ